MTGVTIATSFETVGLNEAVARLMRLDGFNQAQLMDDAGALLESSTRDRFDTKTAPDGSPWADWSEDYASSRRDHHSLLVASGGLRESIASYATGTEAAVGSNMVFAAIHNFGGEPVGSNIPARPFLGISSEDERGLGDLVAVHIEELMQ